MLPAILTPGMWADADIDGVFAGVPNKAYHAAKGVSSSYLKRLAVSPANSQLPVEFSATAQRSIDVGTMAHGFLLEGLTIEQMGFTVIPGIKTTTKPNCVTEDMVDTARAVEAAVFADIDARRIASRRGRSELSLRAYDADTGLTLKARFDYCEEDDGALLIFDLKTTSKGASPESFGKECDEREYLLQSAHYLHVAKLLGVETASFRFVAACTDELYEVGCHDFGPGHPAWEPVNERLHELYTLHAQCAMSGCWPKNRWGVGPVEVPNWSRYAPKRRNSNTEAA